MNDTIQFDLGGGRSLALPAQQAVATLLAHLGQQPKPAAPRYKIGQIITAEGGIYAGDILGDDGVTYGLVIAEEQDIGKFKWGAEGERDLSTWDGLGNTNRLCKEENPAAFKASRHNAGGHGDWYLPSRRELLVAAANVPSLFSKKDWYWTSTPYGSVGAWAVGFERGVVGVGNRIFEFRVRPFRRFTY